MDAVKGRSIILENLDLSELAGPQSSGVSEAIVQKVAREQVYNNGRNSRTGGFNDNLP